MRKFDFNFYLEDIHTRRNIKLERILKKRFKGEKVSTPSIFWNAKEYKLHNVELFQNLSLLEKKFLLAELSQDRIREAYHIEKSGIAYGSKMTMLSETMDERVLYGSFTGDEARHFKLVEKYYDSSQDQDISDNSFLSFLSQMIDHAPKKALVFMIQVLLEGWGLEHYSTMANSCQHEDLKGDLKSILDDEVVHHGSGVILFEEDGLSKEERTIILSSLTLFLQMVQVGPIGVMTRLESLNKDLSQSQKRQALTEMEAVEDTQHKLNILKRLIKKAGATSIIEELDHKGYFKAFELDQMVSCLVG